MKNMIRAAVLLWIAALSSVATATSALPTGGTVTQGAANIASSGTTMTVTQTTNRAVINWATFDVGANATVNFVQPTAQAAVLNRVIGATASQIDGAITANGQVIFVNPNGITFGRGAQVDAAAVVASTLDITDSKFLAGDMTFSGNSQGSIENYGRITATEATGYIALLAPVIRNAGYLVATVGAANTIVLGSSNQVRIHFNGTGVLDVTVDEASYRNLVENSGTIVTAGGSILIPVSIATGLYESAINNSGTISADSATSRGGLIELLAQKIVSTGTISANSQVGRGGDIRIAGTQSIDLYGQVTANSANLNGGNIMISAAVSTVHTGAVVAAKGDTGGGAIQFGDVQNIFSATGLVSPIDLTANQINLQAGATVDVSATGSGAGGTIMLQADNAALGGVLKADAAGAAAGGSVTVNLRDQLGLEQPGQLSISTLGSPVGSWNITAQQVLIKGRKPISLAELFEKEECLAQFRDILARQYTTGSLVTIEQASSTTKHTVDAVTPTPPQQGPRIGQGRIEEDDLPEKKSSSKNNRGRRSSSTPPDQKARAAHTGNDGEKERSSAVPPRNRVEPRSPKVPPKTPPEAPSPTPTKPALKTEARQDQPKQDLSGSVKTTVKTPASAASREASELRNPGTPNPRRLPPVNPPLQKVKPPVKASEDGKAASESSETAERPVGTFGRSWGNRSSSDQQSVTTKRKVNEPTNEPPQSAVVPKQIGKETTAPQRNDDRPSKEETRSSKDSSGKDCGSCDTVKELEGLTPPKETPPAPQPPSVTPPPSTPPVPQPPSVTPPASTPPVPQPPSVTPPASTPPVPQPPSVTPPSSTPPVPQPPSVTPPQERPPEFKPPADIPPLCLTRLSPRLRQLDQSRGGVKSSLPPVNRNVALQIPATKAAQPATQEDLPGRAPGGDSASPELEHEFNDDELDLPFGLPELKADFEVETPELRQSVTGPKAPVEGGLQAASPVSPTAAAAASLPAPNMRQPGIGPRVRDRSKTPSLKGSMAASSRPARAHSQPSGGERSDRQGKLNLRRPETKASLPSATLRANASTPTRNGSQSAPGPQLKTRVPGTKGTSASADRQAGARTPKLNGSLPGVRTSAKSGRPGINWSRPGSRDATANGALDQSCERYWPELKAEYERAVQTQ